MPDQPILVPPPGPRLSHRARMGLRNAASDPLQVHFAEPGFTLVAPHRRGRKRRKTPDGRRLWYYRRRWIVERTFAWLHRYRQVVNPIRGAPA